ncbi:MAG: hypothetical protein AAF799_17885 [Myxococcota bacterium]
MKIAMLSVLTLGLAFSPSPTPSSSQASASINVKIMMNSRKPNGKPWDGFGAGGPDPFVIVDGQSYRGDRCQDSFVCNIRVSSSDDAMLIEVRDADMQFDDRAGSTTCAVGYVCETSGATIALSR